MSEESPYICVDSFPLFSMVQDLVGDSVAVRMPCPSGTNPADWTPTPTDVAVFQNARLFLFNGAGLSPWVETVSLPESKRYDTSQSYENRLLTNEDMVTHSHGPEGAHTHGQIACTTWLDFELTQQQLDSVAQRLALDFPELKNQILERQERLNERLGRFDQSLLAQKAKFASTPLIGSHPVYQYVANRYGMNLPCVHWEPGIVPNAAEIDRLEKLIAETNAKTMIWEGDPEGEVRKIVENHGMKVVVVDPLAARPMSENANWFDLIELQVQRLIEVANDSVE
ncbi:MAG: metal ABC transporter substrate-binding protein [Pirellulaceae bacterium]